MSEPRERRAGIVNEVNSQCEASLVCEWTSDLPRAERHSSQRNGKTTNDIA